jgi:phosphoribosylformimino-5-aminoimidazole carboxamide ribotide isomerase
VICSYAKIFIASRLPVLVVPVLDLMAGQVVHARRGDRSNYRPLQSKLTPSSQPLAVVAALLALAPFDTIYVADLDAILRRGHHRHVLDRVQAEFPALGLWLDAGIAVPADLAPWSRARRTPVIGSESLASVEAFAALRAAAPDAVLSLDTRGGRRLGPSELFDAPELWPERTIVMTLDRVGSGGGPSLEDLRKTIGRAPGKRLIAAGGVRNADDLDALEALGAYAVLAATAIHDGTLDRAALARRTSAG